MSVITFLSMIKKEKTSLAGILQIKELNNLYEYRHFLSNSQKIKSQLQTKLASVNYNNFHYETFFSASEINILKKEIAKEINELEETILQQSISVEDFNAKVAHLHKRIDILNLPLSSVPYNSRNNYYEVNSVA